MQAKLHGLPMTDFNFNTVTTSAASPPTSVPLLVGNSTTYLKTSRSISASQLSNPSLSRDLQSSKVCCFRFCVKILYLT